MIRFVNKLAVFWVKTPIFGENIFRIIVSVSDPLLKIDLQICIYVGKGEIYAFVTNNFNFTTQQAFQLKFPFN
jgi:hypothetical protein